MIRRCLTWYHRDTRCTYSFSWICRRSRYSITSTVTIPTSIWIWFDVSEYCHTTNWWHAHFVCCMPFKDDTYNPWNKCRNKNFRTTKTCCDKSQPNKTKGRNVSTESAFKDWTAIQTFLPASTRACQYSERVGNSKYSKKACVCRTNTPIVEDKPCLDGKPIMGILAMVDADTPMTQAREHNSTRAQGAYRV